MKRDAYRLIYKCRACGETIKHTRKIISRKGFGPLEIASTWPTASHSLCGSTIGLALDTPLVGIADLIAFSFLGEVREEENG